MREQVGFRDVMEQVISKYGHTITQKQAADFGNCTRQTAKTRYGIGRGGMSVAAFARAYCRQHPERK